MLSRADSQRVEENTSHDHWKERESAKDVYRDDCKKAHDCFVRELNQRFIAIDCTAGNLLIEDSDVDREREDM